MKKVSLTAAAALALAMVSGASAAATATSTFNVGLTLTPKCYVNISAAPADQATTNVSLTYASFQASDATGSTNFNVRCTSTLGYAIAVTADTNSIAGINYYLKLVAGAAASYTNATGGASLATESGNGSDKQYSIGVSAPANQAGTCATAAPGTCTGSNLHTITVTY